MKTTLILHKKYVVSLIIFTLFLFVFTSCSNYSKLYKSGETVQPNFYGKINYTTVFNLIIIPVEIDGISYQFLFDTGAPMVISKELNEKLELNAITSGMVGDSQGTKNKLEYVKLPTVEIGEIGFNKTVALVADLKLSPEISCLGIDGIIGANLMRYAFWKIDFDKKEIHFSSNKQKLIQEESKPLVLPFWSKNSFTPVIHLKINESLIKNITFDTGYSGYLSLGKKHFNENDSVIFAAYGYGSSGLYGSNYDTTFYINNLVQIDSFSQALITKYDMGNSKKLLGIEFMSQFVLVMDWQREQVELYPGTTEIQNFKSFGFTPKWKDGKLIIGTLYQESLPEKQGLKIGDEIKNINQWNYYEPNLSTYCEMITELRKGNISKLNLVLTDGREFTLENVVYKNKD